MGSNIAVPTTKIIIQESTVNNVYEFDAIGTGWSIETKEPLTDDVKVRLLNRIDLFDNTYSRFHGDTLVASIAAATSGGLFEFPVDSLPLFELYDRLYMLTDGKVDPLIGAELKLLDMMNITLYKLIHGQAILTRINRCWIGLRTSVAKTHFHSKSGYNKSLQGWRIYRKRGKWRGSFLYHSRCTIARWNYYQGVGNTYACK